MTTTNQALKSLNVRRAAEAALTNEQVTRQRVELLEGCLKRTEEALRRIYAAREKELNRGFWGRLKWLVTGR